MVPNNFMEIQMVGGSLNLGNPEWRGAQAVLEIQVDGGVKKSCLPSWGCEFFWNKQCTWHNVHVCLIAALIN